MTKSILIICYSLVLFFGKASAQDLTPLKIDDKVPDISLGELLDKPGTSIHFADLKGKLIILDFWNIFCTSCIKSMPKMDALQKTFKDKIQIIYVTNNTEDEVQALFKRIKIKKPDVPFITGDTTLHSYFPHYGDPFHVWIDQSGKVYGLTFDYCTDSLSISKFLAGAMPKLLRRWDNGINKDFPLLSEQNAPLLSNAEAYAVFFRSLIEYSNSTSLYVERDSTNQKPYLLRIINASLNMLYNVAFNYDLYKVEVNNFNLRKNNRIILETKDSSLFFQHRLDSANGRVIMTNTYAYEIKVAKNNEAIFYKTMQADLNRYLPYKAVIEKRRTKCLVLKSLQPIHTLPTVPCGDSEVIYNDNGTISFKNISTETFIIQLIYQNPDIRQPIIDESNFSGCLNMITPAKLSDIVALNKELDKYGLELTEENRYLDMLIIGDK